MFPYFLSLFVLVSAAAAAAPNTLQPLLVQPGRPLLQDDFERPHPLDPTVWQARQSTRWSIQEGVLQGLPATAEFQQSHKDHNGTVPRLRILPASQDYVLRFSFKLGPGEGKKDQAFFEFGHHKARVVYDAEGTRLVANHEKEILQSFPDFKIQPEVWYHVLAELRGDELAVQFQDGPTFRVRHPDVTGEKDGFGIVGFPQGVILIDELTLSEVRKE